MSMVNPLQPGPRTIEELLQEQDVAVNDLLNACDDYCSALAFGESEQAEDAQRARNRARTRLTTLQERLKQAVRDR